MDDLFHYQYPFRFPDLFEGDLTKHERLVRIELIKTFSSKDVEKRFHIRQFFNTYKISNQKIKDVKRIFIDIIHKLTTSNISDGIILYEKFNKINYFQSFN